MAFEKHELQGQLVANIQSTESSERGIKTIGILMENGELQEVMIPASDDINFYKKLSGKQVSIEIAYGPEIGEIPLGLNLVVHLLDTQVTYWKGNSQDFFNFPHEEASAVTKTETHTGRLARMDDMHSEKSSGFELRKRNGRVVIEMPEDRDTLYALNMLKGKVVSIVFNKKKKASTPVVPPIGIDPIFGDPFMDPFADPFGMNHHWGGSGMFNNNFMPFSSAVHYNSAVVPSNVSILPVEPNEPAPGDSDEMSDEEKEELRETQSIASIIKPINISKIEGVAESKYDGFRKIVIKVSEGQEHGLLTTEDMLDEFTDLNLNKSVLRVFFADGFTEEGRTSVLQSYDIVRRENPIIESEMDDDDAAFFIP